MIADKELENNKYFTKMWEKKKEVHTCLLQRLFLSLSPKHM